MEPPCVVDCCVGCYGTFGTSYSRNPMGWKFFDHAGTLIAVNLLISPMARSITARG
jgi:hypothetical protein